MALFVVNGRSGNQMSLSVAANPGTNLTFPQGMGKFFVDSVTYMSTAYSTNAFVGTIIGESTTFVLWKRAIPVDFAVAKVTAAAANDKNVIAFGKFQGKFVIDADGDSIQTYDSLMFATAVPSTGLFVARLTLLTQKEAERFLSKGMLDS